MTIEINSPNDLKVSPRLIKRLIKSYGDNKVSPAHTFVTVNFRDKDYNAESGGYQPVEIAITKELDGDHWDLVYISNFRYFGYPFSELDIELDFNFDHRSFLMAGRKPMPLNLNIVHDVYQLWERNFLSYIGLGAFDEIKISSW